MMKDRRAVIPIGTILLIVIVIIAGIGIWWYFTQYEQECNDVKYVDDPQAGYTWYYASRSTLGVRHSDTVSVACWWDAGVEFCTNQVDKSIDGLRAYVENNPLGWSESDRSELLHIIDCIKAGCPNCQEV